MKTKDLIRRLQEADPSGELECCVGNNDILFVSTEASFYDGCLQVFERDKSQEPFYNVVGLKYVSEGTKVSIHTLSVEDVILNDPDVKISFDSEYSQQHYADGVEKIRQSVKEAIKKVDASSESDPKG